MLRDKEKQRSTNKIQHNTNKIIKAHKEVQSERNLLFNDW